MRPKHDVTTPLEPDAAETIHFLRNSNDQWQATAERVARQRDDYLQVVKDIDNVVGRLTDPPTTLARVEDILDQALGRS